MSYRYNGAGERVYRTGSGKTVHTVFDPQGHWIGDYDGYGQPLQQAIWLGDLPVGLVARIDGVDRLFYIEPDALGSPRVVIDPTRDAANGGTAVWRWPLTGDAFGEEAPYEDPDGDGAAFVLDLRFPGQQYDSATGFNYNYFRDYDPSTGRYVESDPIGLDGGLSTYAYADTNALINADSDGLQFFPYSRNLNTRSPHRIPDQVAKEMNTVWGVATTGATVGTVGPMVISGAVTGAPAATSAAWNMTANVCKSPEVRDTVFNVCVLLGVCVLERGPSRWVEHIKTSREISET